MRSSRGHGPVWNHKILPRDVTLDSDRDRERDEREKVQQSVLLGVTKGKCYNYVHAGLCVCVCGHILPDLYSGHIEKLRTGPGNRFGTKEYNRCVASLIGQLTKCKCYPSWLCVCVCGLPRQAP